MLLPKISIIKNKGFTLIEILVTLSIFIFLIGISIYVSFDNLQRNFLFSERDLVLSLLERSRSEAINNINGEPHSLIMTESEFKVDDYSQKRNKSIKITGPSEITFQPLSGNVNQTVTIILTSGYATSSIDIDISGIIK